MSDLPLKTSSRRKPEDERESATELCTLLLREYQKLPKEKKLTSSYRRQFLKLIDSTLWMFSEASGKVHGCRYWTPGAMAAYQKHGRVVRKKDNPSEMLQHEHLTPKRIVISYLLKLENPTVEAVRRILDMYNVGVVVTKAEHVRLDNLMYDDPWDRYRRAGLEWVDLQQP